ncbi:MAG: hypothetical protein FJ252_07470 [Phycisphaerae bacterium]|nr:hypothetical protein [Phycisphaerae bacterium]
MKSPAWMVSDAALAALASAKSIATNLCFGVMAFGANTFRTHAEDDVVNGNVLMKLSDGRTFVASVGSESSPYGWVSAGDVTITSMTHRPFLPGSGSFASLSGLRCALIPSSGAMAMLALGGLVAVRSRP